MLFPAMHRVLQFPPPQLQHRNTLPLCYSTLPHDEPYTGEGSILGTRAGRLFAKGKVCFRAVLDAYSGAFGIYLDLKHCAYVRLPRLVSSSLGIAGRISCYSTLERCTILGVAFSRFQQLSSTAELVATTCIIREDYKVCLFDSVLVHIKGSCSSCYVLLRIYASTTVTVVSNLPNCRH